MKIVFFATPQIAQKTFESLAKDENYEISALVTQSDKPCGRGKKVSPPFMKQIAQSFDVPVFQPINLKEDKQLIEKLKKMQPDFFVTFAYGQILTQEILDIPKFGTINVHASLLPKYRGANPIATAILNNDKFSGITTMLSVLALDAGDICLQKKIDIEENETVKTLSEKIAQESPDILKKTLKGLFDGSIEPVKQDEKHVSFAYKFKKEDCRLDWGICAQNICCKVRAMQTFATFKGKKISIIEACEGVSKGECACVINISKEGIEIGTKDKSILIKRVKPEGKKEMDAYSFANGARIKKGDRFD